MSQRVLVGIDLGTTVLKAGAFDARSGKTLGGAARRLPVRFVSGGGRELRAGAIDRALRETLTELRHALGTSWGCVDGIGLAAQGGSSMFADRQTGRVRGPMILWNDARCQAWVRRIAAETTPRFWRSIVLYDTPPTGLGRILWLRETRPGLFGEDAIHVGAGEYLFHKLTDTWRQDPGNAIQVGSYNARTMKLTRSVFSRFGLPLSLVAPLRQGHETAALSRGGASVMGLDAGVPVAGPYIDQEGGYMAAALASDRPLQFSLGTAWVGNFVLPEGMKGGSPSQLVLPAPVGEGCLVVQPLLTGNATWDWSLSLLDRDHERAVAKARTVFAKRLLPPEGMVALPWCTQSNPLHPERHGAGVLLGVGPDTTPEEVVRAVAAGLVFELARVFEAVAGAKAIDSLVVGGGASKAPYIRTLAAAVFEGLPVRRQVDEELSAARGVILPFSRRASQTQTRAVRAPSARRQKDILRAYDQYRQAFEHVYGGVEEGAAFRITTG